MEYIRVTAQRNLLRLSGLSTSDDKVDGLNVRRGIALGQRRPWIRSNHHNPIDIEIFPPALS